MDKNLLLLRHQKVNPKSMTMLTTAEISRIIDKYKFCKTKNDLAAKQNTSINSQLRWFLARIKYWCGVVVVNAKLYIESFLYTN